MRRLLISLWNGSGPAGLGAATAVVVVQRLLHSALVEAPFAPYAAAEWFIRKSPGPMATFAIENLGHNAQRLLGYGFIVGAIALGFFIGRRPAWLFAAAAFVLTLLAAYLSPLAHDVPGAFISAVVAALTGGLALAAMRALPDPEFDAEGVPIAGVDWARRRLLARTGLLVVFLSVFGTSVFRAGSRSTPGGPVRADQPATVPVDPAFAEVPGIAPQITSREDHYTVDISLQDPFIGMASWRLKIDGAVRSPLEFSLADLEAMQTQERVNNLSCISNKVGGHLIGNSLWTGVPLDTLLDMAQPEPDAVTIVAGAMDGYTDSIRVEEIRNKDGLIAFGMNGERLPREHGFPARLLFPDRYGMRNVKWLSRLEFKTEDEEGYWAQRGWDRAAVVRTQSRIDAPNDGDDVSASFICCGIAWAGARRIEAVEVSTDGGESWTQAQLEAELAPLSWRRWQVPLELPMGSHRIAVRATDGTGMTQEEREHRPHPSGASGYHTISVNVEA